MLFWEQWLLIPLTRLGDTKALKGATLVLTQKNKAQQSNTCYRYSSVGKRRNLSVQALIYCTVMQYWGLNCCSSSSLDLHLFHKCSKWHFRLWTMCLCVCVWDLWQHCAERRKSDLNMLPFGNNILLIVVKFAWGWNNNGYLFPLYTNVEFVKCYDNSEGWNAFNFKPKFLNAVSFGSFSFNQVW